MEWAIRCVDGVWEVKGPPTQVNSDGYLYVVPVYEGKAPMMIACTHCSISYTAGSNHLYECPGLNEKIKTFGKRGRRAQPLGALTHTGANRSHSCNCQNCIEWSEEHAS